jgi:hypothetical protein
VGAGLVVEEVIALYVYPFIGSRPLIIADLDSPERFSRCAARNQQTGAHRIEKRLASISQGFRRVINRTLGRVVLVI